MIQCTSCGRQLEDDSRFCGAELHPPPKLRQRRRALLAATLALGLCVLLGGCTDDDDARSPAPERTDGADDDDARSPALEPLAAELAAAFRIDVSDIDVTYDFWPSDPRVEGSATLRFEMRPGQSRPLFHFNPLRHGHEPERTMLTSLELDGKKLDPYDNHDLRLIRPAPSAEPAFEIQRHLSAGDEHTLQVNWSMPKPIPPPDAQWFYSNFDDTEGPNDEIETLWPTISSPEALIRHRIHLRVHSESPYTVLGSGSVRRQQSDAGVQAWDIDTGRPVSSSTVFFAAVPSDRFRTDHLSASGVDVKIVSDRGPEANKRARAITQEAIARLIDDFGPFPMRRVQILLTEWGSGMEYFGATRTGLGALEHELGHMYFGVTAVNSTWRDTWFDESAVVWWEEHASLDPVGPEFRSAIGAGRPTAAPGFDESAYGDGARVLEAIARAMGGDRKMMSFLADLHSRREFRPFTTADFIDDVVAAQDAIDRKQLERWLLSPPSQVPEEQHHH